jgi:hypothetical protein
MFDVESYSSLFPFFALSLTINWLFDVGFEMEQD